MTEKGHQIMLKSDLQYKDKSKIKHRNYITTRVVKKRSQNNVKHLTVILFVGTVEIFFFLCFIPTRCTDDDDRDN